jgi:KUP system potassium uptake protein
VAVTGTITITTLLFFYIARHQWKKPLWLVATGAAFLLTVDVLFLAANLTKIAHGAWLPLYQGHRVHDPHDGQRAAGRHRAPRTGRGAPALLRRWSRPQPSVQRVPGTAVFLNRNNLTAPLACGRPSIACTHCPSTS